MDNSISYIDDNYIFDYQNISYEINQVSPLLELKRFSIMQQIKENCKNYLNSKKLYNIDINNILPRWIMLQFKDKNYYVDPIFPFNGIDNTQLKKDIFIFTDKKLTDKEIDLIIVELDFKNKFNIAIDHLRDFIKSDFYINNYNSIDINIKSENDFYYYSMLNPINDLQDDQIISKKLSKILTFKINKKVISKLTIQYKNKVKNIDSDHSNDTKDSNAIDTDNFFKKIIMCIILRYNILESYNQQLAVLPQFYKYLNEKCNVNFELFASSLNSNFQNYCSLFYDLESHLNSKGNFNLINIKKGIYTANPPFDEQIMKNMSIKFINSLKSSDHELSILITIPAWDNTNYGTFEALELLKKSGYITYIETLDKKRATFFDYYKNVYINPCSIYIILIQNKKGKSKHTALKNIKKMILDFFPIKK